MLDVDNGVGRLLLNARQDPAARLASFEIAILVLICSLGLTYIVGLGHFLGLSLATVMVIAWSGGWRLGLTAAVGVPILSVPVAIALAVPTTTILVDLSAFTVMSLLCGGTVGLLSTLFERIAKAEAQLRVRDRFLPICSYCHRIRQMDDEWVSIEEYFNAHSKTRLSHGICPVCTDEHFS